MTAGDLQLQVEDAVYRMIEPGAELGAVVLSRPTLVLDRLGGQRCGLDRRQVTLRHVLCHRPGQPSG